MTSPPSDDSEAHPYSWSPDDRYLLYRFHELSVVNVSNGESWPLLGQAGKTAGVAWDDAGWAPSGSFVVLTGSRRRNEWKAWDGITYDAVIKLMNSGQKK